MQLSDIDYKLPKELIAYFPAENRGGSRLLLYKNKKIENLPFEDIIKVIDNRYFLILNDTKVVPARLRAIDKDGKTKDIFCLSAEKELKFKALIRGKVRSGDIYRLEETALHILGRDSEGSVIIKSDTPLRNILKKYGQVPLPPYIKRVAEASDADRYQTVYAKRAGSLAAPTAGLHFNENILSKLKSNGVEQVFLTLDIGLGTFKPIKNSIVCHKMHSEIYNISEEAADKINSFIGEGRLPLCVGTTAVRAVESAFNGKVCSGKSSTDIFIKPGYKFNAAKALLTNFHLPKSTLMLLVAAMTGIDSLQKIYAHAVKEKYRFYSYGDAMLVI